MFRSLIIWVLYAYKLRSHKTIIKLPQFYKHILIECKHLLNSGTALNEWIQISFHVFNKTMKWWLVQLPLHTILGCLLFAFVPTQFCNHFRKSIKQMLNFHLYYMNKESIFNIIFHLFVAWNNSRMCCR